MRISSLANTIYSPFHRICTKTMRYNEKLKKNIYQLWIKQKKDLSQTRIIKNYIKPFYGRNIQPLGKADVLICFGGIGSSALVAAVAIKFFGIAVLPVAIGIASLILLYTYEWSRNRMKTHFNKESWVQLDQLRNDVNGVTQRNPKFDQIDSIRAKFNEPQFKHLEVELKQFDEEIRKFKNSLNNQFAEKKQIVVAHIEYLKKICQGSEQDFKLVRRLERKVNRIGTKRQDLKKLETAKQNLHQIKNSEVATHISELSQQILDLINSDLAPNQAKKNFVEYIKTFQHKQDENRVIKDIDLTPYNG